MIKTFYWKNTVAEGATLHRSLQDSGTAPLTATTGTGWTAANNAAGQQHLMVGGSEQSRTSPGWTATNLPSTSPVTSDCWRTDTIYNGSFAAGDWSIVFGIRSVSNAWTGRGRLRVRVWRSTNPDGASATEVTAATQTTDTTVADLSTTSDTTLTATWSASGFSLTNEYLFFQVAFEITTQGGIGNTRDVLFRVGSAYSVASTDYSQAITGLALTASSGGAALPSQVLTGLAATFAGGVFAGGTQRAYLSWAQAEIPVTAGTNQALTGQAMTSAYGSFTAAGSQRAFLSWTQIQLPPTNDAGLSSSPMTASAGTLLPVFGTIQDLTGLSVTASGGTIIGAKGANLTGLSMTALAGTILGSDETIAFYGVMTPWNLPTFTSAAIAAVSGFVGVQVNGGIQVPLVGLVATGVTGSHVSAIDVRAVSPALTISRGMIQPSTQSTVLVGLTGFTITTNTGTIEGGLKLSGQAGTFAAGTLVPALSVTLAGLAATAGAGALRPTYWRNETDATGVWTPVAPPIGTWTDA